MVRVSDLLALHKIPESDCAQVHSTHGHQRPTNTTATASAPSSNSTPTCAQTSQTASFHAVPSTSVHERAAVRTSTPTTCHSAGAPSPRLGTSTTSAEDTLSYGTSSWQSSSLRARPSSSHPRAFATPTPSFRRAKHGTPLPNTLPVAYSGGWITGFSPKQNTRPAGPRRESRRSY